MQFGAGRASVEECGDGCCGVLECLAAARVVSPAFQRLVAAPLSGTSVRQLQL